MAAFSGHLEAIALLLDKGADVNASTTLGTALHVAAKEGQAAAVTMLLNAGADPDARDKNDFTPLMVAAIGGHADAAQALIAGDADVDAIGIAEGYGTGGQGRVNALHLAAVFEHPELGEVLRAAGATTRSTEGSKEAISVADPNLGGELIVARCNHCHVVKQGAEEPTGNFRGPSLVGVFGRQIGSVAGFEYADVLATADGTWTSELIYTFVVDPMLTFPRTRMRWHDGWTEEDAAHIAAYLAAAVN